MAVTVPTFKKICQHCGEDFIASVRRLGVITFRIAMILSALRIMETGNFEDDLVCLDQDYDTAKSIADVLIEHNAKVFLDLPQSQYQTGTAAKGSARNRMHQDFFAALPDNFDRKTYLATAVQVGLNQNSVDRLIRKWCEEGNIVKHNVEKIWRQNTRCGEIFINFVKIWRGERIFIIIEFVP